MNGTGQKHEHSKKRSNRTTEYQDLRGKHALGMLRAFWFCFPKYWTKKRVFALADDLRVTGGLPFVGTIQALSSAGHQLNIGLLSEQVKCVWTGSNPCNFPFACETEQIPVSGTDYGFAHAARLCWVQYLSSIGLPGSSSNVTNDGNHCTSPSEYLFSATQTRYHVKLNPPPDLMFWCLLSNTDWDVVKSWL